MFTLFCLQMSIAIGSIYHHDHDDSNCRSTSGTACWLTTQTTTARESSWTGSSIHPAVSAGSYDAVSDVVETGVQWRSNFQIGCVQHLSFYN